MNTIKIKSGSNNPSLSSQLDELLRKQGEILQISANSLINSKRHYSQQFMPGGLDDNPTITTNTGTTKCIELEDENISNNNNKNTPNDTPKCKDSNQEVNNNKNKDLNLQQIFNKLQLSVQNLTDNTSKTMKLNINTSNKNSNDDEKKQCIDDNHDNNEQDKSASNKWEMRRIWVKSMVLATHFITAVWLTLKDDVDGNDNINGPSIENTNTPK